jgi:V/A-type H+/Na+-transporting ATPase subunit I
MKKVSLVVYQSHLEEIIKNLHEKGLMQVIDIAKEEPEILEELEKAQMDSEAETCALYELRLTRLIDILKKIKPKKKGIKTIFSPELPEIKTTDESSLEEIYSYAEGYLDNTEKKIIEKEEKLQKLNEEKEKLKQDLEKINYLLDFDFNLSDISDSEYLTVKVGTTKDLDFIKEKIKNIEHATFFSKQFGTKKKTEWAVLIVAHKKHHTHIEKISKAAINEFSFEDVTGSPQNVVKQLKKQIKEIEEKSKKLISSLRFYAKNQLSDLLALREEIQLEKVRKEISKNFAKTNTSYIIKGWILEKDEKTFKKFITSTAGQYTICDFENPSEKKDNPPTYMKTPRWAEGFKGLVSMFGTPKYNEIDPTIIMGIFFVLFFGVMLGDGGYGLLILILSLFGYFKLGKHSDMIRNWSFMGIWMGLITTIFGLLTNSFFGNFFQSFIYKNSEAYLYQFELFGVQIQPIVDPIKDPISLLILALVFGLIQLNVGIMLGIIQAFKDKKYKEMLTEKLCWVPLQIGGGILIGQHILGFQFIESLILLSYILIIIGLAQLFISTGPIGFFSITGYVGDWLSYARLLALGLATVGMALAFNEVAKLIGNMIPFIGFIITIIILIVAHLVNLGLQALGAGIHSLRLQYVEFFNRFYEGGGYEFSPFKIKRKYTKIKEEK